MCNGLHLVASVCSCFFFLFNGSIQDIRACQRPRRKRWGSSVFKGQESHVKLPLFTPVTKWTGLDTNCLPMRNLAKSNGTEGRGKGHGLHLLRSSTSYVIPPLPFCFPAWPLHNINTKRHMNWWPVVCMFYSFIAQ